MTILAYLMGGLAVLMIGLLVLCGIGSFIMESDKQKAIKYLADKYDESSK